MPNPTLPVDITAKAASIERDAAAAARRVLDAFYLEGRVLSDAEYAPLRDSMQRGSVLRLVCRDEHGRAGRVNAFFGRHRARIVSRDRHREHDHWLERIEWQPADASVQPRLWACRSWSGL